MRPLPAQGLDHRVQPAELLAEPRLQGRRRAGRRRDAGDRRRAGIDAVLATSTSDGHAIGGRDLDQRARPQAEEPAAPDLARRQDHGVAAQVPPHARQGLLHRLGPVGFRSHRHGVLSPRVRSLLESDDRLRLSAMTPVLGFRITPRTR